ncbi:sigma-70 family RNA polymerase sigma factor [Sandaracinobacteroides saxicola]|uniref:Sigma-70 family RNA polymerase sigma factor n=1 Tax=Sandaracinobacteroides saxicola TaxID=2759707 RepID=A0A7G5IFX9_9SPHN|nr:sigma-70 family RNA polymerase sigma factor [Sandaracinobacteroides saxicola]QMW22271.1 sigma-70 family RNA polymerase sigma factor [Sandaracinobacteroides saxicola]
MLTDPLLRLHPRLFALAYRITGSVADAEDSVQDAALAWLQVDPAVVANAEAWLVRTATNAAIDRLRARRRRPYPGPWLPEPAPGETGGDTPELAASLRLAFMLMLERLTPAQRVALLLHDVFDLPHDEVAAILGSSPAAARQHLARARRAIADERPRFAVAPGEEVALMQRFAAAVTRADPVGLVATLAEDVRLVSDGGGKALAARNVIHGATAVTRLLLGLSAKNADADEWRPMLWNDAPAIAIVREGVLDSLWSVDSDGRRITAIYGLRNPEKLTRLRVMPAVP